MAWFLYAIGTVWVAIGSCMILYTPQTRTTAKSFIHNLHPNIQAAIALISGLLFFMAAPASAHPLTITLFGVLALVKGVVILINPAGFNEKFTTWYFEALSDQAHRFVGIVTVILGTAMISWTGS